MKIAIILGTRPEIIKMSSLIIYCQEHGLDYFTLHTGQHYSFNMDRLFFQELDLPEPRYNLNIGSGSHAEETAKMLIGIEKILLTEKPQVVLVQGDTNTVLAGAITASKLNIKIGHVEAGLRSYNRDMPEEINRVLTDHISDVLFTPTHNATKILLSEGISREKIFETGNTIVDAVLRNRKIADRKANLLETLGLCRENYILTTIHRAENVDKKDRLEEILNGLDKLSKELNIPVIFPIHPRTKKMIDLFSLNIPSKIKIIEPVGFLEFLQLEANARIILTDSGGVQEESCILKVPCLTLRNDTERPETIEVGSNILVGSDTEKILESANEILKNKNKWDNPFGDGNSGEKIIRILQDLYE